MKIHHFIDTITVDESPYHLFRIKGELTVCYASGAICQNEQTYDKVVSAYMDKKFSHV